MLLELPQPAGYRGAEFLAKRGRVFECQFEFRFRFESSEDFRERRLGAAFEGRT